MGSPNGLAIAVLAAGRSLRFGKTDKLTAPIGDTMLGLHAVSALDYIDADHKFVIAARSDHACAAGWRDAGFEVIVNPDARSGMGTSAALSASLAKSREAQYLLICLADMPNVPRHHFQAIIDAMKADDGIGVVASSYGAAKMPPACFSAEHFDALGQLKGDEGARSLLRIAQPVECPPQWLADIDEPKDISRL